jgi:hypothetical protein
MGQIPCKFISLLKSGFPVVLMRWLFGSGASAAETAPAIAMAAALGIALTVLGYWAMDRSVA